ncbi:MAG: aldo/keto reductase, partial [Parasporobacterium sp.]|nr:aldo/keto reductase [Parasporobacterium sp.]
MIKNEFMNLANGIKIPSIAFGTWQIQGEAVEEAVKNALNAGYRHFDTAANYDNQAEIGHVIEMSGCRKDIFLVSKLRAENKSYDT